ncbi:MAG: hypothetical protein JWM57_1862 [Phycisphaerales bacterium]|nr:hypothetical protein [Phycisphaerales bacterium]
MSAFPARKRLPVKPSEENLRKQAKRRASLDGIQLAEAQHRIATDYGCRNWAELMQVVETMNRGSDQLSDVQAKIEPLPAAVRKRDVATVRQLLAAGGFTQHDLDKGLAHAAWYGGDAPDVLAVRKELFDLLLDHGADPDGQYGSAYGPIVFGTGECQSPEGLQWLLDAGCDVTFAPVQTKYGPVTPMSHWLSTYSRSADNTRKHRGIELLLAHGAFVPPEVTPPILAIHRGDAGELATLLDADASLLNRRFPDMPYGNMQLNGVTLLHAAVEFGELTCVDLLLDRHADVNAKADLIDGIGGQTPIFHAVNTNGDGNFHTLQHLIRRAGQWIDMTVRATWRGGDWPILNFDHSIPRTPLAYAETAARDIDPKFASYRKRMDEELTLLRSLDRTDQIRRACRSGDVSAVAAMLDDAPELLTPALWPPAIFEARSLALTQLLLDRGLDPNVCSAPRKPLHLAIDRGLTDIVRLLLSRGARVDITDGEHCTPYDLLCTRLAKPDNADALRTLLKTGAADTIFTLLYLGDDDAALTMLAADPSLRSAKGPFHFTPLQTAGRTASLRMIDALLAAGDPVDGPQGTTNSPLWLACQSSVNADRRIAAATRLIDAGAHLQRGGEKGTTALHMAAWRGPLVMVELLLRRGAREWITDNAGKLPRDYAKAGVAEDREAITETLTRPVIREADFKAAVAAIHAGDLSALRQLLADHPNLVHDRAMEPDCYPPGYFSNPKLLWFVANNPNLIKTMPANITAIAEAIIDAGAEPADLTYTLELVMTSDPAKQQGHQGPLMDLLLSRGTAVSQHSILCTLGHGEREAIKRLVKGGEPITAPIAAGLGLMKELPALLTSVDPELLHDAFTMAVINNQVAAAALCLDVGASVSRPLRVHSHSTALHHAAVNNQIDMIRLLLAHGADTTIRDTLWNATPRQWALHGNHPEAAALIPES